ncbi:MAG TPA: pyridoxamine 5'-phosphate oxidase [Phnomibacter sp.]|nr:pyridoxamine 5'-phosphate oxidase [Phnomibacter sp.]
MTNEEIARIRKDYTLLSLDESSVSASPIDQFSQWWNEVVAANIDEKNAMTLATCGADGVPDARIVLLKGYDASGFVFFTNYDSAKSQQLLQNDKCTLLFFWKEMERQVRITGVAEKISDAESIAYFNSRPDGSKLGAWASPQSVAVAGKAWLKETFNFYMERFKHGQIPKPPHWGGWRIKPTRIEFWQGRPSRMHDRILYTQEADATWKVERLAP